MKIKIVSTFFTYERIFNFSVGWMSIPIIKLLILLFYSSTISALQCLTCQNVADKQDCHSLQSCGAHRVLMNRENGKQNFGDQDYSTYVSGFGNIRENFWIGLQNMNAITGGGLRYQLRVELAAAEADIYVETYDNFSVGPSPDFLLHVGNYRGSAGDSLSRHNGFKFTTKEYDHDSNPGINCGAYMHGVWWFHDCYDSCLTCPYLTPGTSNCLSFSWNSVGFCKALKAARMMVRPM